MSVYEHQQGSYTSYRVARSVDGKLIQYYFPRTRKGFAEAKKRDKELAKEQARAQEFFSGPALRWQKKPKKVGQSTTSRTKQTRPASSAQAARKSVSKSSTTRVSANASPKRATRTKSTATKTTSRARSKKS